MPDLHDPGRNGHTVNGSSVNGSSVNGLSANGTPTPRTGDSADEPPPPPRYSNGRVPHLTQPIPAAFVYRMGPLVTIGWTRDLRVCLAELPEVLACGELVGYYHRSDRWAMRWMAAALRRRLGSYRVRYRPGERWYEVGPTRVWWHVARLGLLDDFYAYLPPREQEVSPYLYNAWRSHVQDLRAKGAAVPPGRPPAEQHAAVMLGEGFPVASRRHASE